MSELQTSSCLPFYVCSAPQCTSSNMKAEQKESCPLTHMAAKQDLGTNLTGVLHTLTVSNNRKSQYVTASP